MKLGPHLRAGQSAWSHGGPISDAGGLHRCAGHYLDVSPGTIQAVRDTLASAAAAGLTVRLRGHGRSMSGHAVPRPGELLMRLGGLDRFRLCRDGTVTVGAGAAIPDVRRMLLRHGLDLPLGHDAPQPASSLGGWIAAAAVAHGGIWHMVERLHVVTGEGRLLQLGPDDDLFRWMFGAMGGLGVVVEATLRVTPAPGGRVGRPTGAAGRVPRGAPVCAHLASCTAIVPAADQDEALAAMTELGRAHATAAAPLEVLAHPLPFRRFTPPLLHPLQADLVAIALSGRAPSLGLGTVPLDALDTAIDAWIAADPSRRRHIQTGPSSPGFRPRTHWDDATWSRYCTLARELDPRATLARLPDVT